MVRASVFYPDEGGKRFDWDYYRKRHIPAVRQKFGAALKTITVEQGLAGFESSSPAPYVAICELEFDSMRALQMAMAECAQMLMADIANFTDAQPVVQISEVVAG